jgi:hypothetical protein
MNKRSEKLGLIGMLMGMLLMLSQLSSDSVITIGQIVFLGGVFMFLVFGNE